MPFQKGNHPKTEFKKGMIPLNKKKRIKRECFYCKEFFNVKFDDKRRKFCSRKCYWSNLIGRKQSDKTKEKRLKSRKKYYDKIGRIYPEHKRIRGHIEYRLWREAVFARDNWTCQKCKRKSGDGKAIYLHPHHILNFMQYIELRFAIDNGITFCQKCHTKFHRMFGYKNNTEEQLKEYLQL